MRGVGCPTVVRAARWADFFAVSSGTSLRRRQYSFYIVVVAGTSAEITRQACAHFIGRRMRDCVRGILWRSSTGPMCRIRTAAHHESMKAC